MAGLVPAIHVVPRDDQDVDARDKPGHDEFVGLTGRTGSALAGGERARCQSLVQESPNTVAGPLRRIRQRTVLPGAAVWA